jgi:hypothetical protein
MPTTQPTSVPATTAVPAPPRFTDSRTRVLDADRPQVATLLAFLVDADTRIRALVAGGPATTGFPKEAWMTDSNPNVTDMLSELEALIADLQAERLMIRFDQPTTGSAVAHYSSADNILHLRPFTTNADRNKTAASVLHEYTHRRQDLAIESQLTTSTAPVEHTAEDELQQEIGGRKAEVYFVRLLMEIIQSPLDDPFGEELTAMVFVRDFESMRTGNAQERRAGEADVRRQISGAYASQIAANAPSRHYVIQLDDSDHATLFTSATATIDLGQVPPAVRERDALSSLIAGRVDALPSAQLSPLFVGASGQALPVISFGVVWHGQVMAEFDLARP